MIDLAQVPVFILAGGLGTRFKEQTEFRPKPMIDIGNRPMLWHIMSWYGRFGFRRFVVCAGFRSEIIKDYFLNYDAMNSDFTVGLRTHEVRYHESHHNENWEVTVAYTGEFTLTGGRIARAARQYLGDAPHFAVTYGDGLCNADLRSEFDFHQSHGAIGTVLGVSPPSRFGELKMNGTQAVEFSEKPELSGSWISGGFFFFQRQFQTYLATDETCVLEQAPLKQLTADGQLQVFRHRGFWACMDTQRDKEYLDELWRNGTAPWIGPPHRDLN